jgi:4-amino-4-deoxy-L-arabinose transferase-like glycosyltransferase
LPARATASRSLASGGAIALVAAALFIALATFGARVHWVEEVATAERDGYVSRAERFLAGSVPRDPYRPLLYPLAVAVLAQLGPPPFVAARLLSNLSAVALVGVACALGRQVGGRQLAAWAAAATAANPNVWIFGQHTTTDMTFAALVGASLVAALAYMERPGPGPALGAGLAWGLAAFTRGNAAFLAPALLVAWGLATPVAARRRFEHLALATAAAVACLVPHWILRVIAFGTPFHDENWKNLAFKLYGNGDWSYFGRVPFDGLLSVVAAEPWAVMRGAALELKAFVLSELPRLLDTPWHVPLIAVGALAAVRVRPRQAGWLVGSAALLVAATALVFFTWRRLLLVLLPIGNVLIFAALTEPGRDLVRRALIAVGGEKVAGPRFGRAWLRASSVAALGLVLIVAARTFTVRLPAFVERHPYVEVTVLQMLDRDMPPGGALAGTSPFLGRYLRRPYVYLDDATGSERLEPARYFARIRPLLARAGARMLVVGAIDHRHRPRSLLGQEAPAAWLRLVTRQGQVVVWQVVD